MAKGFVQSLFEKENPLDEVGDLSPEQLTNLIKKLRDLKDNKAIQAEKRALVAESERDRLLTENERLRGDLKKIKPDGSKDTIEKLRLELSQAKVENNKLTDAKSAVERKLSEETNARMKAEGLIESVKVDAQSARILSDAFKSEITYLRSELARIQEKGKPQPMPRYEQRPLTVQVTDRDFRGYIQKIRVNPD